MAAEKADLVVVHKGRRMLELWSDGRVADRYRVALGFSPKGHKQYEGDGKTPEGTYVVESRNANSAFYKSLKIDYPNAADIAHARTRGRSAGGMIMIHGIKNGKSPAQLQHPRKDWTEGCIAVTDREMDQIWSRVDDGTPVLIMP